MLRPERPSSQARVDLLKSLTTSARGDTKRQVIASQQWQTVKEEGATNEELIQISNEILELTMAIHSYTKARPEGAPPTS